MKLVCSLNRNRENWTIETVTFRLKNITTFHQESIVYCKPPVVVATMGKRYSAIRGGCYYRVPYDTIE